MRAMEIIHHTGSQGGHCDTMIRTEPSKHWLRITGALAQECNTVGLLQRGAAVLLQMLCSALKKKKVRKQFEYSKYSYYIARGVAEIGRLQTLNYS